MPAASHPPATSRSRLFLTAAVLVGLSRVFGEQAAAHDLSRESFLRSIAVAQARADAIAEDAATVSAQTGGCELSVILLNEKREPVAGSVRLTDLRTGKAIKLRGPFHRQMNWYTVAPTDRLKVPRTQIRVEAIRGLTTRVAHQQIDLSDSATAVLRIPLTRFDIPTGTDWRAGNTHLHLMNLTDTEADRYLRVVPQADELELVFLSHLRRLPDEQTYVSNAIVENSLRGNSLRDLSGSGVLFDNGEEHRHNFGRGGEGFGHVMLLHLQTLIRPVSIGPGIMGQGTDGRPLQRGIRAAREQGATVIWCHNRLGFEDLPNWMTGLLHAQNIFDGGSHGGYEDTFYRYLNLGMHVPFSTGTDWFIYDFSRVYVPVAGVVTSEQWLTNLRACHSFITNGPLLDLKVAGQIPGESVTLERPGSVSVRARAAGRADFRGLELIWNGQVVHRVDSVPRDGAFEAFLEHSLEVPGPGWVAVRVPPDVARNVFDQPVFAHTSSVHVEVAGKRVFRSDVARALVAEMENSAESIASRGRFANEAEREQVLDVYRTGISRLEARIERDGH